MNIFIDILLFSIGLILIIKGGDMFVDSAVWIAEKSGIPKVIIGATLVSFATTLPEITVSVLATLSGSNEIAVGNSVGSVNANIGLVLSVCAIFCPFVIKRRTFFPSGFLMLLAIGTIYVFSISGRLLPLGSVILVLIFVSFMLVNVNQAKQAPPAGKRGGQRKHWRPFNLFYHRRCSHSYRRAAASRPGPKPGTVFRCSGVYHRRYAGCNWNIFTGAGDLHYRGSEKTGRSVGGQYFRSKHNRHHADYSALQLHFRRHADISATNAFGGYACEHCVGRRLCFAHALFPQAHARARFFHGCALHCIYVFHAPVFALKKCARR